MFLFTLKQDLAAIIELCIFVKKLLQTFNVLIQTYLLVTSMSISQEAAHTGLECTSLNALTYLTMSNCTLMTERCVLDMLAYFHVSVLL